MDSFHLTSFNVNYGQVRLFYNVNVFRITLYGIKLSDYLLPYMGLPIALYGITT